jgi:hypothetical protein
MPERVRLKNHSWNGSRPRNARKCADVGLIEAITLAAEAVGNPGKRGRDGVIGYLIWLATKEPRTFGTLLGRVLPLQETVAPEIAAEKSNAVEMLMARLTALGDRLPEDHIPQNPAEGFALGLRQYRRAQNGT